MILPPGRYRHSASVCFATRPTTAGSEGEELRLLLLILTVVILMMKLTVLLEITSLCILLLKIWIFNVDLYLTGDILTPYRVESILKFSLDEAE